MSKIFIGLFAAFFVTSSFAFSSSSSGSTTSFGGVTVGPSNVGGYNLHTASDGSVLLRQPKTMSVPGGGTIPIDVTGSYPKSSTAAAIGRFARKALPIASTAIALHELAKELGFGIDRTAIPNTLNKPDPNVCSVAPCYQYRGVHPDTGNNGPFFTTYSAFYNWVDTVKGTRTVTERTQFCWTSGTYAGRCGPLVKYSSGGSTLGSPINSVAPATPTSVPASIQELENAIAQKSGWPTTSALADALKEAIQDGEQVQVQPQTVTGPVSSPGVSTTTINSNNTTTNQSTVNNYTYQGNTVKVTQVTTTTVTNTATGEPISNETTTTDPVVSEPEKLEFPCGIAGKPPCGVKVDETGVKSDSSTVFDAAKSNIDEVEQAAKDALADGGPARSIQAPQWSWTFLLPSGCSPYPLEPFGMSVDVCAFQDTIHDLMSLLWVGAGLFGLLGLLRSAFGE